MLLFIFLEVHEIQGSVLKSKVRFGRLKVWLLGPRPDPKFGPQAMGFEWPDAPRARFWVARPSPNLKNCPFQPNNCSKFGKNQPKSAAQTSLWPKNDSPNPTRAKKCQPKPDPSQKIRGPTQPYWLCRGLSGLRFRIYQFSPTLMQLLLFRLSIFISVLNTKVWVIEYFILNDISPYDISP